MAEDPNDLLLKSELTTSDTLLPPDLGYEAEDLIKLFLKPQFVNTVMAPKRTAVRSEINFHDDDNNSSFRTMMTGSAVATLVVVSTTTTTFKEMRMEMNSSALLVDGMTMVITVWLMRLEKLRK